MSRQYEREIKLFDGRAYGHKVSDYALENGYLDYRTLSKIVGDSVLNNNIYEYAGYENWELTNGLEENEDGDYYEVYQYYIITESGYRFLEDFTDELVYYHEELDMYLWGITHFGTSWDYVLTDLKLVEGWEL
jgi:hypothetical protein